ncbi:Piso0_004517 [Millerozyma farinosa CBS 7064]|uniref:Piso0_004517 protein n=1 Tax=Pichia sorbitophila (strain ATCC MYA-4447 / BCRC 22081 / CBS 7064 / NBRC 10061 / NRRL Y-12695) TaxID=559304 RepID=G8Y5P0_PICSO|nr:Piso0_004517 [Millerozyma farinosa CBS 7064]CCE84951.1 Piso0_004517 [Millerozyma farinosa CBS 7064]
MPPFNTLSRLPRSARRRDCREVSSLLLAPPPVEITWSHVGFSFRNNSGDSARCRIVSPVSFPYAAGSAVPLGRDSAGCSRLTASRMEIFRSAMGGSPRNSANPSSH